MLPYHYKCLIIFISFQTILGEKVSKEEFKKKVDLYYSDGSPEYRIATIGTCKTDIMVIFNDFYYYRNFYSHDEINVHTIEMVAHKIHYIELEKQHEFCTKKEKCQNITLPMSVHFTNNQCYIYVYKTAEEKLTMLEFDSFHKHNDIPFNNHGIPLSRLHINMTQDFPYLIFRSQWGLYFEFNLTVHPVHVRQANEEYLFACELYQSPDSIIILLFQRRNKVVSVTKFSQTPVKINDLESTNA